MDNPQDKKKKDLTNQGNLGSEQGSQAQGQRSYTGGSQSGNPGQRQGGTPNVGGGQNVQDRERPGINKQQGAFGKTEETEEE